MRGIGCAAFDPAFSEEYESQVFSSLEERVIACTRELRVNQVLLGETHAQLTSGVL